MSPRPRHSTRPVPRNLWELYSGVNSDGRELQAYPLLYAVYCAKQAAIRHNGVLDIRADWGASDEEGKLFIQDMTDWLQLAVLYCTAHDPSLKGKSTGYGITDRSWRVIQSHVSLMGLREKLLRVAYPVLLKDPPLFEKPPLSIVEGFYQLVLGCLYTDGLLPLTGEPGPDPSWYHHTKESDRKGIRSALRPGYYFPLPGIPGVPILDINRLYRETSNLANALHDEATRPAFVSQEDADDLSEWRRLTPQKVSPNYCEWLQKLIKTKTPLNKYINPARSTRKTLSKLVPREF